MKAPNYPMPGPASTVIPVSEIYSGPASGFDTVIRAIAYEKFSG